MLLKEEWTYMPVILVQVVLIFFLIMTDFGVTKYRRFKAKYHRMKKIK